MALTTILKGLGILVLLGLIVLLWLNFLRVSNLEDEVRALAADVGDLKRGATPAAPASATAFDVETQFAFAGDPGNSPPVVVPLAGGGSIQQAVVALVEVIRPDGVRTSVATPSPQVLLPNMWVRLPLPAEAGCYPSTTARPTWILALDGANLRVASRDCIYQQPVRGRLRGTITR